MLLKGDCIEVMKAMKPNSVDAIVCDPPYGLEFMGKEWDRLGKINSGRSRSENEITAISRGPEAYKAGLEAQLWHTQWLTEAYRVLKPGGSMLVMGGTRTSHRLACAIEDSGFIIKDTLMWIFGSGFPKAQDLGKMIDKRMGKERKVMGENIRLGDKKAYPYNATSQIYGKDNDHLRGGMRPLVTAPSTNLAKHWDGFKVGGIKPAYEPIIWAVKPPEGSYVDNVLKWGVGAVNVAETRINTPKGNGVWGTSNKSINPDRKFNASPDMHDYKSEQNSKGRFPANIILSHHPECVQVGTKRVKGGIHGKAQGGFNPTGKTIYGKGNPNIDVSGGYENETVESWDCHPDCAVRLLDEQSGELHLRGNKKETNLGGGLYGHPQFKGIGLSESGYTGASRFFYCAKASRGERNAGLDEKGKPITKHNARPCDWEKADWSKRNANNHPTVKPIKLFEWLIKLVTREGQIILDPFIGSGTTAIATHNADRKCIGIEKEDEYIEIAKRRVLYWQNQPIQQQLALGEGAS